MNKPPSNLWDIWAMETRFTFDRVLLHLRDLPAIKNINKLRQVTPNTAGNSTDTFQP